jgi:hypothetical protein
MLYCGGDIQRVFDGPTGSFERYLSHVSRIAEVTRPGASPLIVLVYASSQDASITILHSRRALASRIQGLTQVLWTVFASTHDLPRLLEFAREFGDVREESGDESRIWTTRSGDTYLIVSPSSVDIARLRRLSGLVRAQAARSLTDSRRPSATNFQAVTSSDPPPPKKP